jgi:hypothetical protein
VDRQARLISAEVRPALTVTPGRGDVQSADHKELHVEQLTPSAVIDLYTRLSDEDKSAFRRLFGQRLVAEELFLVMDAFAATRTPGTLADNAS